MITQSRRRLLLGTASLVALSAVLLVSQDGHGLTAPDFFVDSKGKKELSFSEARKMFGAMLDKEIAASEKDFGRKYTEADMRRIHARVWDQAQVVLSEYYTPQEKFP
jgi:hypothetical protein